MANGGESVIGDGLETHLADGQVHFFHMWQPMRELWQMEEVEPSEEGTVHARPLEVLVDRPTMPPTFLEVDVVLRSGKATAMAPEPPTVDNGEDGDGDGEWQDWLVDDRPSQERIIEEEEETSYRHDALIDALSVLNDRERRIFEARRLRDEPETLEELSEEFAISRERVRQIEVRAFEKVQQAVRDRVMKRETAEHAAPL